MEIKKQWLICNRRQVLLLLENGEYFVDSNMGGGYRFNKVQNTEKALELIECEKIADDKERHRTAHEIIMRDNKYGLNHWHQNY